MFEYLENTADDRTFNEIVMTIWSEVEKRCGYPRWLKEDVQELLRRYTAILKPIDEEHLNREVDE